MNIFRDLKALFKRGARKVSTKGPSFVWQIENFISNNIGKVEMLLGLFIIGLLIYTHGFYLEMEEIVKMVRLERQVVTILFTIMILRFLFTRDKYQFLKDNILEAILISLFFFFLVYRGLFLPRFHELTPYTIEIFKYYHFTLALLVAGLTLVVFARNRHLWLYFSGKATITFVSSFLLLIIVGTGLLQLPVCSNSHITFVDALFTATSAVCVTGLSPFNVSEVLTMKGQLVLLFLFQVGGLGIISLTTFFGLMLRKGVHFKEEYVIMDTLGSDNTRTVTQILRNIIYITFSAELIGAIGLFVSWHDLGMPFGERAFKAIFHSVSAFCNAGFSIFPAGLQEPALATNLFSNIVFMMIILTGGLGYYTYLDLFKKSPIFLQLNPRGVTLQTKIILYATIILFFGGAIMFWLTEYENWKDLSIIQQAQNAFFTSVTARTAGFSIIEMGDMTTAGVMVMCLLMYIGGAPNSTAGGVKVTTVFILLMSFWADSRGKDHVNIGWNTLEKASIRRAILIFIISNLLIFGSILLISIRETNMAFVDVFFEVFSSIGTVGLSRGITGDFSNFSKIVLCGLMFSGKIGLITIISFLGSDDNSYPCRYPEAHIIVG
ncbi:potassium transporter TrkG [Limibacter armeniacum]|uniref:TrkH family potassium uptake protein n=1 Tax=Limibacter armeniacum TaxID=466084 RepID=UPI002FE5B8E9